MAPEKDTPDAAAAEKAAASAPEVAPHVAASLEADDLQANLSFIATAQTNSLSATASAVGVTSVAGDASIAASVAPLVYAKGDVSVKQCYTSAVIAGGNTSVHQAGAPIILGKTMDITQGGGCMLLTGEADVKNSWVGLVLSPKTTVSEDSRVIIDTKAALIIAAALLGIFGIAAIVAVLGMRRFKARHRGFALPQLPSLAEISGRLPQLSQIEERLRSLRRAA